MSHWKQRAEELAFINGWSWRKVAEEVGIAKSTVSDYLRKKAASRSAEAPIVETVSFISIGELIQNHVKSQNQGIYKKDTGEEDNGSEVKELATHSRGAKVLFFDIETSPILGNVWSLWQQNVGLNQIAQDWYVLSWAAKWQHEDKVMYQDKRASWDSEDDSELLEGIWKLLDEADIVVGQNSKRFDEKKLNARFVLNGMKPPSTYRSVDTLEIAKRHFGFTSNKLEYMSDKLCKRYKKLKHGKFAGFELWKECLRGNTEAWDEMEDYNIHDVLALEELYDVLKPWYRSHPNMNIYTDTEDVSCVCGAGEWVHNGYHYTNVSKFDRFRCNNCGATNRGRVNLLLENKRASLKMNVL